MHLIQDGRVAKDVVEGFLEPRADQRAHPHPEREAAQSEHADAWLHWVYWNIAEPLAETSQPVPCLVAGCGAAPDVSGGGVSGLLGDPSRGPHWSWPSQGRLCFSPLGIPLGQDSFCLSTLGAACKLGDRATGIDFQSMGCQQEGTSGLQVRLWTSMRPSSSATCRWPLELPRRTPGQSDIYHPEK